MKTARSALSGIRSSLKKSLMPSARVWAIPKGPARLGPIRLCMSEITLRSNQIINMTDTIKNAEDDQHLDEHDEEDRPAHAVGVEGIPGGQQRVDHRRQRAHGVSIRTSTTGWPQSMRSATVRPSPSRGTLKSAATTLRGRERSGTTVGHQGGGGGAEPDRSARGHPQVVEIVGVGPQRGGATRPARAGTAPTAAPRS